LIGEIVDLDLLSFFSRDRENCSKSTMEEKEWERSATHGEEGRFYMSPRKADRCSARGPDIPRSKDTYNGKILTSKTSIIINGQQVFHEKSIFNELELVMRMNTL
jgi:hypothetical protein